MSSSVLPGGLCECLGVQLEVSSAVVSKKWAAQIGQVLLRCIGVMVRACLNLVSSVVAGVSGGGTGS